MEKYMHVKELLKVIRIGNLNFVDSKIHLNKMGYLIQKIDKMWINIKIKFKQMDIK